MGANEPCAEDLIPKNRQNNVYGHGHVNGLESVLEAAEYNQQYSFNKNITLTVDELELVNGHHPLMKGQSLRVDVSEPVDTIQWMSNDLRDSWSNIHTYDHDEYVILTYEEIVHELEHLPGIELYGNHTISMRALEGTSASPLISIDVNIQTGSVIRDSAESSTEYILYGSIFGALILGAVILIAALKDSDEELSETDEEDSDIEEVVNAEIID